MFAEVKETKEIKPLQKGVKLSQINAVSATKLLAIAFCEGEMITDSSDCPQFFTLKLTSNKTKLVKVFDEKKEPDYRSLSKLNQILTDHYKLPKQSWTHLVSIGLKVSVQSFTSSLNGQSSLGIVYEFDGKAEPLPDELQQKMFYLVQSDEVKNFLLDPFGLSEKKSEPEHLQDEPDF
jgi:hypothetical protein